LTIVKELPELESLVAWIDRQDGDPLDLLTDAVILSGRLGDLADDLVDHFVQRARKSGASWAEIGQAIGVSKQAAQKRFVRKPAGLRGPRRGLFTRFGPGARAVVKRAVANAHELGSSQITTLHLVAALTERSGGLADVLEGIDVQYEEVHLAARTALGEPAGPSSGHIPFAGDSKKVLELSLREAIRAQSRNIGAEHILLGILRDERSSGALLLVQHGVSHEAVTGWLDENRDRDD
jgi:hypothetical protein